MRPITENTSSVLRTVLQSLMGRSAISFYRFIAYSTVCSCCGKFHPSQINGSLAYTFRPEYSVGPDLRLSNLYFRICREFNAAIYCPFLEVRKRKKEVK